jgi:hypothetical protein
MGVDEYFSVHELRRLRLSVIQITVILSSSMRVKVQ